jgi:hypothetical protein
MSSSAVLRLRVFSTLSEAHQRYVIEEIRGMCRQFTSNRPARFSSITDRELLSEVWIKLFGAVVDPASDHKEDSNFEILDSPVGTRVQWLIEEIGGWQALAHRCEDILRKQYGRGPDGTGPRLYPLGEGFDLESPDSAEPPSLDASDAILVWKGLCTTARQHFPATDDVVRLVDLILDNVDLLDDFRGSRWPINEMCSLLNQLAPNDTWNGARVDNAKRRLLSWIQRLQQVNGLDRTDLQALFAKVARNQHTYSESQVPPERLH